jgi:hypothetical protein
MPALRNFVQLFDENGSLIAQAVDYKFVVDDFVADVDGGAVPFERKFHDLDGAIDPCAKATRRGKQDFKFRAGNGLFSHRQCHLDSIVASAKSFPLLHSEECTDKDPATGESRQNCEGMPSMKALPIALPLAVMLLAGCARDGELDVSSGVGITATRTGCPVVAIAEGTGDITLFTPPSSQTADAVDVVATITKVRPSCTAGEKIYSIADFEVHARRNGTGGARSVTLPYFSTVVQGGSAVIAKRVGQVTINFADGQDRATAMGKAASYIDPAAASLPPEIVEKITRKRKAGDADAALDPMADPAVRAAMQRASFELLIGFQLTEDQLRYNVTR